MGKWKYSPNQIASQISNDILERLKLRWDSTMQTTKDIYEQTMRQQLPSITNAEVKESMKKNEEKMTLRFNTCLILLKDIEHIIKNATGMWKNIYHLHKQSDFPVEVKDDDNDDEEEGTNIETIQFDNEEIEEDKEEEATEEDKEDDEEIDPMRIVAEVISSLPHSPRKSIVTSSLEIASASLIVTTTDTSNV